MDPTRSFYDRFTPRFLGTWDIGTRARGISSWFGLKKRCGTIRLTQTGVDHSQKQKNDIFLFVNTDRRLRQNKVDTVIDSSHIDQWTKRFGLNWSGDDSFMTFEVLTLLRMVSWLIFGFWSRILGFCLIHTELFGLVVKYTTLFRIYWLVCDGVVEGPRKEYICIPQKLGSREPQA